MAARKKTAKAAEREQHLQEVFDRLAELLRSAGHEVTVSKSLDGRGGDCLLRGSKRVIVSRRLPLPDRIEVLVDIARRADLSGVEIPEDLHEMVGAGGGPA